MSDEDDDQAVDTARTLPDDSFELPDRDDLELGRPVSRADALAAGGLLAFAVGLFLPWLDADGRVIIVDGEGTEALRGIAATDVQLVAIVVAIGALVAAIGRYSDDDRYAVAGLAVAGIVAAGLAAVYALDPVLGLTAGALADPEVDPGLGVYLALVAGFVMVAAAADYGRRVWSS